MHTRREHVRNKVDIAFACCVGLFGSREAFSHFRSCDVCVAFVLCLMTQFNFTNEVLLFDL